MGAREPEEDDAGEDEEEDKKRKFKPDSGFWIAAGGKVTPCHW